MSLTPYHQCNEKIMDMAVNHMASVVGMFLTRELACPVWSLQIHDVILWI